MHGQPRYFTPKPILPRLVRVVYSLLFVGVLLAGAYYAIIYAPSVRDTAALAPSAQQFVPHTGDGETVHITPQQQFLLNLYGALFAVSLLVWLMLGLLLEIKLKIHIFRGVPAPLPKPRPGPPTSFSPN